MRPHGESAHAVNQVDGFARRQSEAIEIGRSAVADEPLERLLDALDVTRFEQRLGNVRATDAALAGDFEDALEADRLAEGSECIDHLFCPREPRFTKLSNRGLKGEI